MRPFLAALAFALSLIIFVTVSGAEENKNHICFRALDANQDDQVTLDEFEKFYPDGKKTFEAADLDKDGRLSHDEYHGYLGHGAS